MLQKLPAYLFIVSTTPGRDNGKAQLRGLRRRLIVSPEGQYHKKHGARKLAGAAKSKYRWFVPLQGFFRYAWMHVMAL